MNPISCLALLWIALPAIGQNATGGAPAAKAPAKLGEWPKLSEISTAASEQSDGVNQVGIAVNDLDRMTQQNAALVEQTAAAAAALQDQAVSLATEVARFKLPAVIH